MSGLRSDLCIGERALLHTCQLADNYIDPPDGVLRPGNEDTDNVSFRYRNKGKERPTSYFHYSGTSLL
jgi:hypothetical protein